MNRLVMERGRMSYCWSGPDETKQDDTKRKSSKKVRFVSKPEWQRAARHGEKEHAHPSDR
jgi:hypothetical protein